MARRSPEERTRRRFVRRRWARRWLTWRYVVAVLVLLALVGGGVYAVYFSSALSVQGVDVAGAETVAVDDVLAAADVPTGGPLATLDLVAIQRRVAARLDAVRTVEVTRRWPHDVLITVVEREPLAVIQLGGRLLAVDESGAIFDGDGPATADLPRIETPGRSVGSDADARLEAVRVVAALPDQVRDLVDHVELRSVDEVDLVLRDDRLVRWGSAEASQQKGEVLLVLLRRQQAEVYDVSVPDQPTTSDRR